MQLLIDVGNSRIKWAELCGGVLGGFKSCTSSDGSSLPDELRAVERPEAIYIASVAGKAATQRLIEQLTSKWGVVPHRIDSQQFCCGVTNGYREATQMGVDRWAAMIGAFRQYAGPLCVVDCGSAMTVDVVNAHGHHLGGLIVPGFWMQQRQLIDGTAGISILEGERENETWGRDTTSCIQHGAIEAMAGLVERSVRKLSRQLVDEVMVVMTGGDAVAVMSRLTMQVQVEEHLVLQGMAHIVKSLEEQR